ncbi:MAG TPA: nucleotidyltransferase domain-containing protein [Candidatus Nanopelagicales bacterium]|nr:nucleotidyltransferase domain-containing protein [Candidatus Nanopelagicales bacterium]
MVDPTCLLQLDRILGWHGLSLDELFQHTSAIALFGSRAGGCARPASDWDILCVGSASARHLPGVDLVWIDASCLETAAWLGGDLAGHIAAHGVWLHGAPAWRIEDVSFSLAARRKEQRIARRIASIAQVWELWRAHYRQKHALRLRRDVQRLALLRAGIPIPPTAALDSAWDAQPASMQQLEATLHALGADRDLAREIATAPQHPKLREVLHQDFTDLSAIEGR